MQTPESSSAGLRNLREQLALSYSTHPQFNFDVPPFQLDPALLQSFHDSYEFLSGYGGRLAEREFESARKTSADALSAVFAELARQTSDVHEARFLQELHAECTRLLTEEAFHYHRRTLQGRVSLKGMAARDTAVRLLKDRHYFGRLSASAVARIMEVGAADLSAFRESARHGRVRREDLSFNTGPRTNSIMQILNEEFADQGVLDTLSVYMGQRMWVSGAAFELSVPQATWWSSAFSALKRAPRTLYAHVDESIEYPKSIVYLTDVDMDHGPTSCYVGAFDALAPQPLMSLVGRVIANVGSREGSPLKPYYAKTYHQSMSSENFRRHFMRLPASIRFNSHFGWDICPDSEAEQALGACERVMTGDAGTYIVFDGARLLHRGGMVRQGERVALQVVFSNVGLIRRVGRRIRGFMQ
jgi:hypothetical protein